MDGQRIQLLVPGRPFAAEPDADIRHLLKIEPISSNQIQAASRGEPAQQTLVEGPGDAIVKLEYESGLVEWLRLDQLQSELGPSRAAGPTPVPVLLNRSGAASRGAADWALKAMHVFGISPVDKIAQGSAALIVGGLESKLDTGLFRLKADGSFGERITDELPADTQTYLVFIHGTASSTQGSFSGFWDDPVKKQPTDEWKALQKTYGNRILALEHRTLSVSPAQNTLDLVRLLPPKATVHVITHSRGGLVGELLGLKSLTEDDLKGFAGRPDQQLFSEVAVEITRKEFNIAKFVRTACPAAGTILASKRIDLYLNVILNAIGLIPGLGENPAFAIFKAAALQLIKLRADPALLPGLEAQMPESPVIHLLNTRGRFSDADLGVIAGDFEGSGVWGTLKEYALRAYYLEDNDFVVNTKSMSGGMERKKGVWRFLDQGSTVNHFSYFKNARTREQILNWLSGGPAENTDFQRVRGVEPAGASRGATRGAEEMPVAFLVPDLFGTCLEDKEGTRVWPEFDALAKGRFLELAGDGLVPGLLHESYKALFDALSLSHDTIPVPYDWRGPVAESATKLETAVSDKLAGQKREVRFIAHGMGGLVVREFARRDEVRWKNLCGENGGLLMLGTPTRGSWHVMRLLAGRSRLVRMIALLGRHRDSEVVPILQGFRGPLDLLPEEMLDLAAWHDVQLGRPAAERLQAAAAWRKEIRDFRPASGRNLYVAGTAPATPSGVDDYTAEGDGQTTYSLGIPPNARVWYSPSDHGGLVSQAAPIVQLLNTGASGSLDSQPHPAVSGLDPKALDLREEMVFFPGEEEFLDAVFGRQDRSPAADDAVIRVRVAHGHLREARHPLAVGHYAGDGIVSGEAELDRQLGGMLSTRFHMELYPGRAGTAEVVRAPGAHPPGALIAGLGEVGEITSERLRKSMLDACLRYALMRAEESKEVEGLPRSAAFSSMLIGISGGRAISIGDSVKSIVLAAMEANRELRRRNLWDRVRIDEVEFIELYEHLAIQAAHAVALLPDTLKNERLPNERIVFEGQMRTLNGGRFRPPEDEYATGWWRRIQITKDRCEVATSDGTGRRKTASSLVFENLTDRARAEESRITIQSDLLDSLLAQATSQSSYEESGAVALFELLLPNGLKDQSSEEQADLVLVLDEAAAAFPWEILAARTRDRIDPLSVKAGMIRQLKLDTFRMAPRCARDHNALVIGDTLTDAASGLPELFGAQREAQEVAEQLTRHGYLAEPMIRQPSLDIIRKLFARDYRIMHLAGHGIYNPEHPEKSGMVLGPNQFLTSLELGQVRNLPEFVFINCCYLARIDTPQPLDRPHKQAASVAQALIEMGVKAVVAAGWAVNDAAGLVFARSFYQSMLGGLKFGESVKRARQETHALGANNTWGAYQCYGNPDFALTTQSGPGSRSTRTFYSRRECLDALKDVAAAASGAPTDQVTSLTAWVAELDRVLISTWRDGESLSALAEAYRCLEKFEAALEAYEEALRDGNSMASVQTIEHLANLQDRHAARLFAKDPDQAGKLWEEAERRLRGLNDVLGKSSERLALLGALYKRKGKATEAARATYFQNAADFYQKAYNQTKATESRIDPYSGLNAVALSYVVGARSDIAEECIKFAAEQKDYPDFWARVYRPDALLLEHLRAGDLDSHLDEVVKAYKGAFQHGTPYERDSALGQLRFLLDMAPAKDEPTLQRVLDGVS